MKLLKISLAIVLFISITGMVGAQSTSKKKIVVVEKVTDNNGVVTTKKVVKEGAEAEKYMMEKKMELGLDEDVKHIKKEVRVDVRNGEIEEERKIVIKIKDDEGEEEVLMWDGNGEMPEEMKKHMKEANVDIDIEETSDGEVRVVAGTANEKPRLGVVPENHVDGVKVVEVLEDSAAEKAGLMKGDIIYEVAEKAVGSGLQLSAGLDKVAAGGSTIILFLRDGVKKSVTVNL